MTTETATEKTPVAMTDGRTVLFNKKQRLIRESSISEAGEVSLRLDFRNGETRNFTVRGDMLPQFAAHGASQKLGDEIAGEANDDDAVVAVDDLIARLNAGEWTIGRKAGEFAGVSTLIRALVEATGKPIDEIKAYLSTKTKPEKAALRMSSKIRPIIDRIEAEKPSKKVVVDTDSLLGELGLEADAPAADAPKGKKAA